MKKQIYEYDKEENLLYIDMDYMIPISEILNPTKLKKGDSYVNYTNLEWIDFSEHKDEILKEMEKYPSCMVCPLYRIS